MVIEVFEPERRMLVDLIATRINEIHSEVRRSMFSSYRRRLRGELAMWRALQSRLKGEATDTIDEGVAQPGGGLHHPEP
jgi:hypothetical protein